MSIGKQHDTVPWTLTATDGTNTVDLTSATSIRLLAKRAGVTVIDQPVTGDAQGKVVYQPTAGDVSVAGTMQVELEVTWPDTTVQTFPKDGYVPITLEPDIPHLP